MQTSIAQSNIDDQEEYEAWVSEQLQLPVDFENFSKIEKLEQIFKVAQIVILFEDKLGTPRNDHFFLAGTSNLSAMLAIFATQYGENYLRDKLFKY